MAMFRTGGAGLARHHRVPRRHGDAGIASRRSTEKLGIHTSNTVDLAFDDARVPASAMLGAEGEGSARADDADGGRIGIAAQAVGILAACLDASVAFAKERVAFGKRIGAFKAYRSSSRAWRQSSTPRACSSTAPRRSRRRRGRSSIEAAKAKLFASTKAREHAAEAIQIHGGYGYTKEFPVERYYRDAKITEIYEGTTEIQRLVIARALLRAAAQTRRGAQFGDGVRTRCGGTEVAVGAIVRKRHR